MLLRWILPHECPKEALLHTVPVKPYCDAPISQQAEHCVWHSLSQHGRMIGSRCLLPNLPLIVASAERAQKISTIDLCGGTSAPWECDRVYDLSSAPLVRLKLWRHLMGICIIPSGVLFILSTFSCFWGARTITNQCYINKCVRIL